MAGKVTGSVAVGCACSTATAFVPQGPHKQCSGLWTPWVQQKESERWLLVESRGITAVSILRQCFMRKCDEETVFLIFQPLFSSLNISEMHC